MRVRESRDGKHGMHRVLQARPNVTQETTGGTGIRPSNKQTPLPTHATLPRGPPLHGSLEPLPPSNYTAAASPRGRQQKRMRCAEAAAAAPDRASQVHAQCHEQSCLHLLPPLPACLAASHASTRLRASNPACSALCSRVPGSWCACWSASVWAPCAHSSTAVSLSSESICCKAHANHLTAKLMV